eukprot:4575181-Pyramimonas_sp.AAC.1
MRLRGRKAEWKGRTWTTTRKEEEGGQEDEEDEGEGDREDFGYDVEEEELRRSRVRGTRSREAQAFNLRWMGGTFNRGACAWCSATIFERAALRRRRGWARDQGRLAGEDVGSKMLFGFHRPCT